jgi:hypothetical protein
MSLRLPNSFGFPFPGKRYKVCIEFPSVAQKSKNGNGKAKISATEIPSPVWLDEIKHLLSRKPLRRPNRTRPLS